MGKRVFKSVSFRHIILYLCFILIVESSICIKKKIQHKKNQVFTVYMPQFGTFYAQKPSSVEKM